MQEFGIGLLGFGTVGSGVVRSLQASGDLFAQRLGVKPVLRKVADIDITTDRGLTVAPGVLTTDAEAVIDDPSVDVIVEVIGGTGIARELVKKALSAGKPVVTANKALLAKHGDEIFGLAAEKKVDIGYGASVGGGIPIIRVLREGLPAARAQQILGIFNGTCNYILTRMEREGLSFEDALKAAQAEGYAEADPTLDVEGFDTAHKVTIMATLAFGFYFPMSAMHIEGIRSVAAEDIRCASELGYRIKLLGVIRDEGEGVDVRVHPTLVPLDHMLAAVNDVFNGILLQTDLAGDTLCYGRGAGSVPTASTILADLGDILRNLQQGCPFRVPVVPLLGQDRPVRDMDDTVSAQYLRYAPKVEDANACSMMLAEHGIAPRRALRIENEVDGTGSVVVVTDPVAERLMRSAEEALRASGAPVWVNRIRVQH